MWEAIEAGRGDMAQFSHPEFSGSGQWLRGGMVMIGGDMFNRDLSARVGALADDLAQLYDDNPELATPQAPGTGGPFGGAAWWPAGLHSPSTSGAQNGVRYAWFPMHKRLAIERDGSIELYDTQDLVISGVSQQQNGTGTLSFSSQNGPVDLTELRRVPDANSLAAEPVVVAERRTAAAAEPVGIAAPSGGASPGRAIAPQELPDALPDRAGLGTPHDVLDTIGKLAELHQRGVLTEEEFKVKKADLLSRL